MNEKNELRKSKLQKVRNKLRRVVAFSVSLATAALAVPEVAYAGTSYLDPINKLKTVFLATVGAAGIIVLLYGIVKFAESFQKKDQNGEYSAIYTIVAGAILTGASAVLTALT